MKMKQRGPPKRRTWGAWCSGAAGNYECSGDSLLAECRLSRDVVTDGGNAVCQENARPAFAMNF